MIPPCGAIGGHTHNKSFDLGFVQLGYLKLGINDQNLIRQHMSLRFCQQLLSKSHLLHPGFAAHNPAQQGRPFALHLARYHDHPKDNRWQRSLRQAMEMLPNPSFEARTPETSDIHTHGLVPFMPSHTPLIFACHIALPIVQQIVALPRTMTQRRPTPPHDLLVESLRIECRKERTATRQECAAHHYPQDVHQRQVCSDRRRLHDGADCLYSEFNGG